MNVAKANALLALTTCLSLALLLMTMSVFGRPDMAVRYVLIALFCSMGVVVLNRLIPALPSAKSPPMIAPGAPKIVVIWVALFPLLITLSAALPVLVPGADFALMLIIASVWCGMTLASAIKAQRLS
ncbi:hypothetical protein Q0812_04450 [Brevundimonas sp. 2R-24]|uniref:NADH dehydrogenase subunit 6 n=1 Tax=Peiella sedimenti TaxID=3061083 RepID=A0ABT8SJD3_9CAUL|nr:hypothetical protein [Caulobacteraceae bacterium XZ-24]